MLIAVKDNVLLILVKSILKSYYQTALANHVTSTSMPMKPIKPVYLTSASKTNRFFCPQDFVKTVLNSSTQMI